MIFVIIPAYNEAKSIGRVIRGLFELESRFRQNGEGFKLIVVDDGSTDRTAAEAKTAGAIVITHQVNRGQGAALQTGNEYARRSGATTVVHFDADGQFNPADIQLAIERLRKGNLDIVLGSRFLDNRSHIPWMKRYIILPISRWINFVFTGLLLTDAHNGFRVLSRHALETITIAHDGMAHNSEIVAQIKKYHLRFAEHPVEVVYNEYGQGIIGGLKVMYHFLFGSFVS